MSDKLFSRDDLLAKICMRAKSSNVQGTIEGVEELERRAWNKAIRAVLSTIGTAEDADAGIDAVYDLLEDE